MARGRKTAAQIDPSAENAEFFPLDVTDFAAFDQLVSDTVSKYGRLDFLFNNAGVAIFGEARDCAIQDWRQVIDTNLYGPVNGVAAAYPLMVAQGSGHIVNIASGAGLVTPPVLVSYTTSKHGVVGLSLALRIEGADLGVKVSVVCPGFIQTPIYQSRAIKLDQERMLADAPKGMTPEGCACKILKGVQKNKAIILVTALAKIAYALHRISPGLYLRLGRYFVREMRKNYRIDPTP
jgi:NAD(P)-dependent dehydrogenase (short-subunit alcohol dehydrogenase family)